MTYRDYFNDIFFNTINNSVILIEFLAQIFVVIFRNDAACLRELGMALTNKRIFLAKRAA